MFFKALALFFASAAIAQSKSGFTTVSFEVAGQNPTFGVVEDDCSFFPYRGVPVQEITITPVTLEDPSCTFYTDHDCEGQDWTLKKGEHSFSRDFFVGSFVCSKSE